MRDAFIPIKPTAIKAAHHLVVQQDAVVPRANRPGTIMPNPGFTLVPIDRPVPTDRSGTSTENTSLETHAISPDDKTTHQRDESSFEDDDSFFILTRPGFGRPSETRSSLKPRCTRRDDIETSLSIQKPIKPFFASRASNLRMHESPAAETPSFRIGIRSEVLDVHIVHSLGLDLASTFPGNERPLMPNELTTSKEHNVCSTPNVQRLSESQNPPVLRPVCDKNPTTSRQPFMPRKLFLPDDL